MTNEQLAARINTLINESREKTLKETQTIVEDALATLVYPVATLNLLSAQLHKEIKVNKNQTILDNTPKGYEAEIYDFIRDNVEIDLVVFRWLISLKGLPENIDASIKDLIQYVEKVRQKYSSIFNTEGIVRFKQLANGDWQLSIDVDELSHLTQLQQLNANPAFTGYLTYPPQQQCHPQQQHHQQPQPGWQQPSPWNPDTPNTNYWSKSNFGPGRYGR